MRAVIHARRCVGYNPVARRATESEHRQGLIRTAIVQDHLVQIGGAERVLLAVARALPGSDVYTSFYEPSATYPEMESLDINTMPINRISALRSHHRLAFPLLAPSFSATKIDADVTVCATAGWSHGVRTSGAKIAYWYAPARWLYQLDEYAGPRRSVRAAAKAMAPFLGPWDRHAVASVDRHIALSSVIQNRIRALYRVEVDLLAPPSTFRADGPIDDSLGINPGFILCVARLLPYKNVDVVIEAIKRTPHLQLVIVGRGPETERLKSLAPKSTVFLEGVTDAQLRSLYRDCCALVAAAHEDFGLTPLEAAAFGRPSAVLASGGFLDTVIDGETGVTFETATPEAVSEAINRVTSETWSEPALIARADTFSEAVFAARLNEIIATTANERRTA
ncbi:MAG: glycosyltransferase [Actinobacteria bacterium]|uniref:Unannotated protein n=1 Tax=freshwater metagenome TaxID=449393 RepID=A0A6J6WI99_9ZZZZ|nr:glycosyltransferase [Actinomycetota bacterium]